MMSALTPAVHTDSPYIIVGLLFSYLIRNVVFQTLEPIFHISGSHVLAHIALEYFLNKRLFYSLP